MRDNLKTWPEKIWFGSKVTTLQNHKIEWSTEQTSATDIEYVRADLAQPVAPVDGELTYEQLEKMYFAQCSATDDFAAKYEAEVERKGDARIAELEKQLAAVNAKLTEQNVAPVADERAALTDVIAESLGSTIYCCTRSWNAWGVGTMTERDFCLASEDSNVVGDIADAVIVARAALSPQPKTIPIGYINRPDIARLSNYKATIWPSTNEIDAVAVYANADSGDGNITQPKALTDEDRAKLQWAIRETEYKYFGDYEFSPQQHDAVTALVECARRALLEGAKP